MIFQTLRDQTGQPAQQPGMGRHMRSFNRTQWPRNGMGPNRDAMSMSWGHGTGAQGPAPVGAEMMRSGPGHSTALAPDMTFTTPAVSAGVVGPQWSGGGYEGVPQKPGMMTPQGGFGMGSPFFSPMQSQIPPPGQQVPGFRRV